MRRRKFITLVGGAAAWPLAARGQRAAPPAVGFLHSGSPESRRDLIAAFQRGLAEIGYREGQTVAIEYRWAGDQYDRLPDLAADLVANGTAVIVAFNSQSVVAAKMATTTIPIVFLVGADPGENGFVGLASILDPPGDNFNGFVNHSSDAAAKRLELLHELLPAATSIAYLANPTNSTVAEAELGMTQTAAHKFGVQLMVLNVSDPGLIEAAFVAAAKQRVDALLISSDALFFTQRYQIIALAARHALPGIYSYRDAAVAGGLMSYGTDVDDVYRQVGRYTGRVLKGEKPADLPLQFAPVRLVINMKIAKALGLTFPVNLLGRADELIE